MHFLGANFNQVLESFPGSSFHLTFTANKFVNNFQELNLQLAKCNCQAMGNLFPFAQIRFLWVEPNPEEIMQ